MPAQRFPNGGDELAAAGGLFDDALHAELFQPLPRIGRDGRHRQ